MTQPNVVNLSETDLRRIACVVRRVERDGPNARPRPPPEDVFVDSVPIYNASGHGIPEAGIVHMNGMQADDVTHTAYRPIVPFFDDFGIACTPIPDGGMGRAWIHGDRKILLSAAEWAACAVGEWVIATADAFTARIFDRGNMLILRKLATPFVYARLRNWDHG